MGWLSRMLTVVAKGGAKPSALAHQSSDAVDILGTGLVQLTNRDVLTVGDLCTGVAVFGATGSGKTSGSGQAIALPLLASGFGGLVLAAKTDERELWERYAVATGRTEDMVFFGDGDAHRFNFLDYEYSRAGKGGQSVENVVRLFMVGMEALGAGEQKASGNNAYWQRSMQQLLRNAVALNGMATGHIKLSELQRIIQTAPRSQKDVDDNGFLDASYCYQQLKAAYERAQTPAQLEDVKKVMAFWLGEWTKIPEQTQGNILSTLTSATDAFGFSPFRELFCSDTTITPEQAEFGKVIFLDLNIKQYKETGQFAQVLFKTCFQNAIERRDIKKSPMPVFLWADEAPYFMNSEDESVLRTARSKRLISVYLMQNITTLFEALGGQQGRDKGHSILTNLATKIFHANGDVETNRYAAETIGQNFRWMASLNSGENSGGSVGFNSSSNTGGEGGSVGSNSGQSWGTSKGSSMSQQLHYEVQPQAFTQLRTGGERNSYAVDAFVVRTGQRFSNGKGFLPVTFFQE